MSRYQANKSFKSHHGHEYTKGVIIGGLRYSLLHHDDKTNFDKVVEHVATVVHHTTHHVIYDNDPFYNSVVGYPVMGPLIDPGITLVEPVWERPVVIEEPVFGGGSGGGAGAGESWADPDNGQQQTQQVQQDDGIGLATQDPQFDNSQVQDTQSEYESQGDAQTDNSYGDSGSSDSGSSGDSGGGDN